MTDSDFNTPPWLIALIEQLDPNNGIGLDPCSNDNSMAHATTTYDIVSNGLIHSWRGHGLVFMNPPHSMSPNNIEPWIAKFIKEFETLGLFTEDQLVGLVPAKTDTQWFHAMASHADGLCFLKGRPKFWQDGKETTQTGKFASLVFYAGFEHERFRTVFEPHGLVTGC